MFIEPICNTTSILQLWVYYLSFNFLFIALLSVPSSVPLLAITSILGDIVNGLTLCTDV